ncbi:MAG: hypothetical protein PHE50_09050 [Dehalococcoidales bacterium]|nr:hypothetical protein [Dehalococcoidales bacterium]
MRGKIMASGVLVLIAMGITGIGLAGCATPARAESAPTPTLTQTLTPTQTQTITTTQSQTQTTTATQTQSPTQTQTGGVSYAATIQPIFNENCLNCHISLSDYTGTMASGYVVAKNAAGSLLYRDAAATNENVMPPGAALTATQVQAIKDWINQGAPNN